MTTIERTRGGFPMGWILVALFLAAVVVLAPLAAMPAMQVAEIAEPTAAKAPADMEDAELRAEIDSAEVEVVAAWDGVVLEWDEGTEQEAFAAALAARQAASKRYIAANEEAIARGWYSFTDIDVRLVKITVGMDTVPAAQPVNSHATLKHLEATSIHADYLNKHYQCMRVYNNPLKNRLLYRFTYATMTLEGGMITTVSGKPVTAYLNPPTYWDHVVVRDGYTLKAIDGDCKDIAH